MDNFWSQASCCHNYIGVCNQHKGHAATSVDSSMVHFSQLWAHQTWPPLTCTRTGSCHRGKSTPFWQAPRRVLVKGSTIRNPALAMGTPQCWQPAGVLEWHQCQWPTGCGCTMRVTPAASSVVFKPIDPSCPSPGTCCCSSLLTGSNCGGSV